MKYPFITFLFLLLFSGKLFAQKKHYQSGVVAFYNLENLFDTKDNPVKDDDEFTPRGAYHYTEDTYKAKLHNLAMVLQQLGTDVNPDGPAILGIAEIENGKVLSDLINQPEIRARNYKYVWHEGPDPRGIDVALIYSSKYFRVLSSKSIYVNLAKTGGKELTRDILFVTGIFAGDTMHILVNHWPSRYGGVRATEGKRAIAAQINKHISDSLLQLNPHSKILIMGDLNDDPVNKSVSKVLGVTREESETALTSLYNPWVNLYKQGKGTLGYRGRWNLFDQIIMSGSFFDKDENNWKFCKAEIFKRDFLLEKSGRYQGFPHRSFIGSSWKNGYSDHLPVLVFLVKQGKHP